MTPEVKTKWIEALRSGEFQQGKFNLYNSKDNTYCCLGVLCKILNLNDFLSNQGYAFLTKDHKVDTFTYMRLNDTLGHTFSEIANHIEMYE